MKTEITDKSPIHFYLNAAKSSGKCMKENVLARLAECHGLGYGQSIEERNQSLHLIHAINHGMLIITNTNKQWKLK